MLIVCKQPFAAADLIQQRLCCCTQPDVKLKGRRFELHAWILAHYWSMTAKKSNFNQKNQIRSDAAKNAADFMRKLACSN